ncbi:MAG: SBBP repeat-containing protein [Peptococcaceae bacterium]|nr:SBBP repeat-containing protein [Peptococcaceae bacterium]
MKIKRCLYFSLSLLLFPVAGVKAGILDGTALNDFGYIKNKGQIVDQFVHPNHAVKYLLCCPGFNIQLRQTGFSYDTYTQQNDTISYKLNLPSHNFKNRMPVSFSRHYQRVDVEFMGCNPNADIIPIDSSETYLNYFTAGTPVGGVTNVHYYKKILYRNIYPNIDVEFYASSREYNFIVHPGGKIEDIKMVYKGADHITLLNDMLKIEVAAGTFYETIPQSYLKDNRQKISIKYDEVAHNVYVFTLPEKKAYTTDLIIDPTPCLDWGTYYGMGGGENIQYGLVLDKKNNVYISGSTQTTAYIATAGAYQTTYGGGNFDVVIAKFNSTGNNLLWGTYYGGTGDDDGFGIALDSSNNVYVAGWTTSSSNIATLGSHLYVKPGGSGFAIFLAKFNSTGSNLLWGTYYGAGAGDGANNIAVGPDNNVYVTGATSSTSGIATPGAYQTTWGGAFVAKFNSSNSNLIWGTYYNAVEGWSIAFDNKDCIYFTGDAQVSMYTTTVGAYQTFYGGGFDDAYVAKLNPTGSKLIWSTLYGGPGSDEGIALSLDAKKNIYVTGLTDSSYTGIATPWAYQTTYGGGSSDGFVAKFDSTCSKLLWGTYYGGKGTDGLYGIALDKNDDIYVAGYTDSSFTGIATPGAYQTIFQGISDPVVAKFNSVGNILWGTYLGKGVGSASDLAVDTNGNIYVAGYGGLDSSLYTPGAYQKYTGAGWAEFFLAKLGCNIPNSIDEIRNKGEKIKVYPNPSKGIFNVEMNIKENNTAVEIYNVLGEDVYKSDLLPSYGMSGEYNYSGIIDLSKQSCGIYFYRILTETGDLISEGELIKD